MGSKIGMHIALNDDGSLKEFWVPSGSKISYRDVKPEDLFPKDSPEAMRSESVVQAMYAKLEEQPVAYGALLRLCRECKVHESEVRAMLGERAVENGDHLTFAGPRYDYLVLESRVRA